PALAIIEGKPLPLYLQLSNDLSKSGCDKTVPPQGFQDRGQRLVITPRNKTQGPNSRQGSKPVSRKDGLDVLKEVVERQLFIGIDVSKARLDVALRPAAESFSVSNNQRGIAALIKQLKKLSVGRIVLE